MYHPVIDQHWLTLAKVTTMCMLTWSCGNYCTVVHLSVIVADWLTSPGLHDAVRLTYVPAVHINPILFHHHLLTMGQPVIQWLASDGLTSNHKHLMAQVNLLTCAFTVLGLTERASSIGGTRRVRSLGQVQAIPVSISVCSSVFWRDSSTWIESTKRVTFDHLLS
jgi:hypothetical protein